VYPILIAAGVSLPLLLGLLLLPENPFYFLGPFLGLVTFFPLMILLSRRASGLVQPMFEQAERQAKAGNIAQALQSLEKALVHRRWQLFLDQQIYTQMGTLHYGAGDEQQALEYLAKGYPKISQGHLILGALRYRRGELDEALKALETGIKFNKRSPILYNVLAWILAKEGRRDEAIAALDRGLKAVKGDEPTQDNLERLRNEKKMAMKGFGQLWYMLKFETMPGMVAGQPVRKGFRQQPKGKGRRRKR